MWRRARWGLLAVALAVLLSPDAAQRAVGAFSSLLGLLVPFAPYATAVAAGCAAVVALRGLRQRSLADDRQEWWKRAEYAITLALDVDDDATASTGMELLTNLRKDRTATPEDAEMLRSVVEALIDGVAARAVSVEPSDTPPPAPSGGGHGSVGRLMARLKCRER